MWVPGRPQVPGYFVLKFNNRFHQCIVVETYYDPDGEFRIKNQLSGSFISGNTMGNVTHYFQLPDNLPE